MFYPDIDNTIVNTIALPCATFLALYPFDREIVENDTKVFTCLTSISVAVAGSVIDSSPMTLSNKRALAFTALSITTFASLKQLYDNHRRSFPTFGFSFNLRFFKTFFTFRLSNEKDDEFKKV